MNVGHVTTNPPRVRRSWHVAMPYSVIIPKTIYILKDDKILFQEWTTSNVTGEKVIRSQGPFGIKSGKYVYLGTKAGGRKVEDLPLTKIRVWKKPPNSEIRCNGTETYEVPSFWIMTMIDLGLIYFDVTNSEYAVEDRRVYLHEEGPVKGNV